MNLRCKPGDVAVVVKRDSLFYGRFVRVVRLDAVCHCPNCEGRPAWQLAKPVEVQTFFGSITLVLVAAFDEHLKPIRGEPGRDETLTWAKVPA